MDPTTGHGLCKSGRLCLRRECKRGGGAVEKILSYRVREWHGVEEARQRAGGRDRRAMYRPCRERMSERNRREGERGN